MKYFLCKLIPPRPLFGQDLTEVEAKVMGEHVAHWTKAMEQGTVIAFGPVADPKGFWGVGLVQVENEVQLEELTSKDPIIQAALGFRSEVYAMPQIMLKAPQSIATSALGNAAPRDS